jgi:hypothetical protein
MIEFNLGFAPFHLFKGLEIAYKPCPNATGLQVVVEKCLLAKAQDLLLATAKR